MGLGDMLEKTLSLIGVTSERVEKWLGKPCGCKERQQKLNQLGWWFNRMLSGKSDSKQHLESLLQE